MLLVMERCLVGHRHLHWEVDWDEKGYLTLHKTLDKVWNWHVDQAVNRHRYRHLDGRGHRAI